MNFNLLKKQQKTQKKKEKSRGRSMVEMLGVLAIIGVLSIGGIQGYTIAMRRYRANEAVNVLTKYANLLYTDFYNYMVLHPDDVSTTYEGYACKGERYFSHENCPFYSDRFLEMGLGPYPKGIVGIYTYRISPESEHFPFPRVEVRIDFDDHQLCEMLSNMLSMYVSDSGDEWDDYLERINEGVHCVEDRWNGLYIDKGFTIEGVNTQSVSHITPDDSSYSGDW